MTSTPSLVKRFFSCIQRTHTPVPVTAVHASMCHAWRLLVTLHLGVTCAAPCWAQSRTGVLPLLLVLSGVTLTARRMASLTSSGIQPALSKSKRMSTLVLTCTAQQELREVTAVLWQGNPDPAAAPAHTGIGLAVSGLAGAALFVPGYLVDVLPAGTTGACKGVLHIICSMAGPGQHACMHTA